MPGDGQQSRHKQGVMQQDAYVMVLTVQLSINIRGMRNCALTLPYYMYNASNCKYISMFSGNSKVIRVQYSKPE